MAKKRCPEFENHERWLVSYADMVTLLFAVFVVLYALNLTNASQSDQVAGSMQESFNTPLEDIPADRRVGPTEAGIGIFDSFRGDSPEQPMIQQYPGVVTPVKVIDEEMDKITQILEERLYGPEKFRPQKDGEDRIINVIRTAKGFKLRLMARHFYGPGDYSIRKRAYRDLDEVAKTLKDLGRPITIEGHTDSVPPKGRLTNWEISGMRATHIVRYFIREHNFPASHLSVAGYADVRPIAHNGTAAGRSLNRRIEINVDYDSDVAAQPF